MTIDQRRLCGPGSLLQLRAVLDEVGAERILLLTGTRSYTRSGAEDALQSALTGRSVHHVALSGWVPELGQVREVRIRNRAPPPDVVLAVGGGKVLDMAKLIGAGRVPLVAIPTTAGSGSEATRFAAYYVRGVKRSADHVALRPAWAIVDPALSRDLPAETAAAGAFDALTHAIESSWSVRSTPGSRALAYEAVRLITAHLVAAVKGDPRSREAMAEAAHLAGRAIDETRTTAAHALSYTLTWRHHVPHGHAVALPLGRLFEYNAGVTEADCTDPRGPAHVRGVLHVLGGLLGCESPDAVRSVVRRWMRDCGLAPDAGALGLGATDLAHAVASVDPRRLRNNPRAFRSPDQLLALFDTESPGGDPS